ncbi:MAG: hypothetical protein ABL921_00495 [Pirellula sp.]
MEQVNKRAQSIKSVAPSSNLKRGGICIAAQSWHSSDRFADECNEWLAQRGVSEHVDVDLSAVTPLPSVQLALTDEKFAQWTPNADSLELSKRYEGTSKVRLDLEDEILIAMLASPVAFTFPSLQELESHIRVRSNIVETASRTFLSFAAYEAERPWEYWEYDKERGFVVRPGKSMIEALQKATQPETDSAYSFSCYRATEYIVALGLALEARKCNQELLKRLQRQAETRAIKSGEFHEVFMKEYGSRESPLPSKYYVPGDRVWFRNPDAASSDAMGFEGSWVFYLGGGLFSDFWKRNKTFTLQTKSLEIFHWRHATYRDNEGELRIDESVVQKRVQLTLQNPQESEQILHSMEKLQDPRGVYADGGCIDPTREYPRWVQPHSSDIVLPDVD